MSVYAAPVEVCNAALAEMGDDQIVALTDGSPAAITLNTRYEPLVKKELTKHGYSWAKKVARLVYQGETGNAPTYAYYLPNDVLTPRWLMVGHAPVVRGYQLSSNKLLVDVKYDYDLHYTWRVPESQWPADFADAMVKRLHSVLLRALPVDYVTARERDQAADFDFSAARIRDRMANGKQPNYSPDPVLVQAWRGASPHAQA
ncbi:MAG: hypothetical protein GC155_06245 [Alphaproteobacteria bacterium]|nr:hypothetical protein [Alphaproteobacteria bacterium]